MKYDRFEDLPVWQAAVDLAAKMIPWTKHAWFRGQGDLSNQLQRAALSISNNIAEGFERGTKNELLQFLYIARGSAGEVRSMLCVIERMLEDNVNATSDIPNFRFNISQFKQMVENISRQLSGWANSLQNSEITGQRHLTDKTKQAYEQRKTREDFWKQVTAANEEARRKGEEGQDRS